VRRWDLIVAHAASAQCRRRRPRAAAGAASDPAAGPQPRAAKARSRPVKARGRRRAGPRHGLLGARIRPASGCCGFRRTWRPRLARAPRQRGKSEPIDALNAARAASRKGWTRSRRAEGRAEAGSAAAVDHRERLVRHRVELNSTPLWHLHDLLAGDRAARRGVVRRRNRSTRIGRRLARAEQTMRVRPSSSGDNSAGFMFGTVDRRSVEPWACLAGAIVVIAESGGSSDESRRPAHRSFPVPPP
jgi:hypothetical protein